VQNLYNMENYLDEMKQSLKDLGIPLDENSWNFVGKFIYFYEKGVEDGKKEMRDKILKKINQIKEYED